MTVWLMKIITQSIPTDDVKRAIIGNADNHLAIAPVWTQVLPSTSKMGIWTKSPFLSENQIAEILDIKTINLLGKM